MCRVLGQAPPGSAVVLHPCAHNPTGVDPTADQWRQLSRLLYNHRLFPFFDSAYQGFASGDFDRDALALRIFLQDGHRLGLAQSFAKNMVRRPPTARGSTGRRSQEKAGHSPAVCCAMLSCAVLSCAVLCRGSMASVWAALAWCAARQRRSRVWRAK